MPISAAWIDAFTDRPGAGNPAGVVILTRKAREAWMQGLATELGLSETAFARHLHGSRWELRWFTPAVEVDLCGHATLATAWYLHESGRVPAGELVEFETRSGILSASVEAGRVSLDFPAAALAPCPAAPGLEAALGVRPLGTWDAGDDLLVLLADPGAVSTLDPDIPALGRLPHRGVIVTAEGGDGADFVSRFFCPAVGIAEDPVTGSAHTALGPFWGDRLGRSALRGRQLSARGGTVEVELHGERLTLCGPAVTVWQGTLGPDLEAW